ncbi:MAG: hypothetical protein ACMG57_03495 [Candidatus Dojkabacteria bacterium]
MIENGTPTIFDMNYVVDKVRLSQIYNNIKSIEDLERFGEGIFQYLKMLTDGITKEFFYVFVPDSPLIIVSKPEPQKEIEFMRPWFIMTGNAYRFITVYKFKHRELKIQENKVELATRINIIKKFREYYLNLQKNESEST